MTGTRGATMRRTKEKVTKMGNEKMLGREGGMRLKKRRGRMKGGKKEA